MGWRLETEFDGIVTAVVLSEVEAYDQADPASHSYRGPTPRTEPMFGPPGRLYVYRSYGIHWCVNLVTGPEGHGAAVLLRAGSPVAGEIEMIKRRGRSENLADGPGKLTQALAIHGGHSGMSLTPDGPIRLRPTGATPRVIATPRIGISKAKDVPWRFVNAGAGVPESP